MEGFFCFVFYKSVWSTNGMYMEGALKMLQVAHMKLMMEECSSRSSRTFLDCFTTWQMQIRRKPYSQSLAQRSKQRGDFFQRLSRVWTVQAEKTK